MIDPEAETEEKASYALICEFFTTANKKQRHEMIEMLKERVQQFCYIRDGSIVAEYCVLYGNEKQRVTIVKSFKGAVVNAVKDVFAQHVILSVFDTVDDVVLINNFITKELGDNIGEIIFDNYGQCVLQHIIHRLNTVNEHLKKGDENERFKKFVKYRQIFDALKKPLFSFIVENMEELLFNNSTSTFVFNILEPKMNNVIDSEYKAACFKAIAQIVGKEFIPGVSHIMNSSRARPTFISLLKRDHLQENIKLSDYLSQLPIEHLTSFIAIDNGYFVLRFMVQSGSLKAKVAVAKALKKAPYIKVEF